MRLLKPLPFIFFLQDGGNFSKPALPKTVCHLNGAFTKAVYALEVGVHTWGTPRAVNGVASPCKAMNAECMLTTSGCCLLFSKLRATRCDSSTHLESPNRLNKTDKKSTTGPAACQR